MHQQQGFGEKGDEGDGFSIIHRIRGKRLRSISGEPVTSVTRTLN